MSSVDLIVGSIFDNRLFDRLSYELLRRLPKKTVEKHSRRYIAGTSLEDAIRVAQDYNRRGISVAFDILGENVEDRSEAEAKTREYSTVVDAIRKHELNSQISFKLTMLGLDLPSDTFNRNLEQLVSKLKTQDVSYQMDMEDSGYTEATLQVYDDLSNDRGNPLICIQANLRRSHADVLQRPAGNFRLVKGIYVESEEISYKDKKVISQNYKDILRLMARTSRYVAIATHDKELIDFAFELIEKDELKPGHFEFQMLHGVGDFVRAGETNLIDYVIGRLNQSEKLKGSISSDNLPLRIYLPYGEDWYRYCMRRFRENPHVAGEAIRNHIISFAD